MDIREANPDDLNFLAELERECFSEPRRVARQSLKNSVLSAGQVVLIAEVNGERCGAITLIPHKRQMRICSLAVKNGFRGQDIGGGLIQRAIETAQQTGIPRIALEADIHDERLVRWYENFGFEAASVAVDYYGTNEDALKMVRVSEQRIKSRNIIVTDYETGFFEGIPNVTLIRAKQYIEDDEYQNIQNAKIFNLCSSLNYQTVGYYVSLLALARNHSVYPNIISLRDFKNSLIVKSIGDEIHDQIQRELAEETEKTLSLNSCFGYCDRPEYQNLVRLLNLLYEAPLIRYQLEKKNEWSLQKVNTLKLSNITQNAAIKDYAKRYFSKKQFISSALNRYAYDMAILVDDDEAHPPSCRIALNKFKLAARALGFYVEFITKRDYKRIPEFDALFIRATTNVNNYTYDFSRYAYAEGLVVIDDPWSILRCSNKLYLFEALKQAGIHMPKTWTINKNNHYADAVKTMTYPIILKQPDSAFSLGVYKADNPEECMERLSELLKRSEIIIAQEYLPTAYDWRIGVLDKRPVFACKYYMAKDHWQIYNWEQEDEDDSIGDSETLPVEKVPKKVIASAIKAANIIGDGFYGVDIKMIAGEPVVIEVNDNPSVDFGVEDAYLKDQLYTIMMRSFYNRLENDRRVIRKISY